ncbi:hypothetical protein BHM03_00004207 [Ensete ventricosum]|uniref:Glutamine amidotransferase domain-containing protein n=1 Tax=Ensete ventricosum TaxID=4639 RepID=A0A445MAE1_ENSVE|nr:hypothetical protein BHM03_00004207 [Ensete ventricosum]
MKIEQEKRYALLLAARDSDYVKKMYNGYFNVFVQAFGEEGENWELFRVVEGEFPDMENLDEYDGFVISGSPHDAYGNDLWILRLCFLLQTLHAMHKKVLGICFGHQVDSHRCSLVICRALGGRVAKAGGGWDVGIRKVVMVDDDLPRPKLFDRLGEIPTSALIVECHQDEVWQVPVGAEVIGFSEKTGVEMFCVGDHILGIQGHPEYGKDILYNLMDRLVSSYSINVSFKLQFDSSNQAKLKRCFADDVKASLEETEPDKKFWEKLCKTFLKDNNNEICCAVKVD